MTKVSRRRFIEATALAGAALAGCQTTGLPTTKGRPNVLLIMTDDQGMGDLGCMGNPYLKTPNMDRLYSESTRLEQYHNCPVCAPTRASLMTGRYNYRTCAIDTYRGRAMMHPDETTLAEMFSAAGYRTGIFGKWHLGDCFPMRAMDQGFQESLVHLGGGLMQPSDRPESGGYFDPVLMRNGAFEQIAGYCTDIFADAAIAFIEAHRDQPFFCYFPTNAPHTPLEVEDRYVEPYKAMGLPETTAKVYGMLANLDENLGRLLDTLDRLNLADDTIVIFMTDNGGQMGDADTRYNAGLRGKKTTVYQGGINVPCFIRWPSKLEAGREIDRIAAHIDIAPTLLHACGIRQPREVDFDGCDLWPLLTKSLPADRWPDRTLFFQWHRGDVPEPYNNCAARTQRYKLVNGVELYDLDADPAEEHDVASQHPDMVARLRAQYENWLDDVSSTRGYAPPRIVLGDARANPVYLSLQDQRGGGGEGYGQNGFWATEVARAGTYSATLHFTERSFAEGAGPRTARVEIGGVHAEAQIPDGETVCTIQGIELPTGPASVRAWFNAPEPSHGAWFVDIAWTG